MRSSIFELPRLVNVVHKIGKATPEWTMPRTKGFIFFFPDFQFVRSIDKSHFSSQIGRNWTISQAMLSIHISKPAKKRCNRLYFESVQALPGIATAIQVRHTVRTLSCATMKRDNKSALALFHLSLELKISVSFATWHMKFVSLNSKKLNNFMNEKQKAMYMSMIIWINSDDYYEITLKMSCTVFNLIKVCE